MTVAGWVRERRPWLLVLAAGGVIGLLVSLQQGHALYYVGLALAVLGALAFTAVLLFRAPEILFAVFMTVGSFKAGLLPLQESLGLDFTVAAALLVMAGIAMRVLRRGHRIQLHWPILSAYLLLMGWMCFSMIWSPATGRGWEKSARFATLTLLAFVTPMFLLDSWSRLMRFLGTLFLAGVVFATVALTSLYLAGESQRLVMVLGADYLTLGHVCGLAAGLATYFLVFRGIKWWLRLVLLISLGATVLVMLLSGARGPVIAWLLAFVPPTLLERRPSSRSFSALGILFFGLILVTGGWMLGLLPHAVTWRFELLYAAFVLRAPWAVPLVPRIHIWQVGLDMFHQHPILGGGVGAFWTTVSGGEIVYPHNLFLEASAELGVVGLMLTLFLVTVPLVKWRQRSGIRLPSHEKLLFSMTIWVYAFFFIGAMKSGDFNSNRALWMSVGMVISVCMLLSAQVKAAMAAGNGQISGQGQASASVSGPPGHVS